MFSGLSSRVEIFEHCNVMYDHMHAYTCVHASYRCVDSIYT